MKRPLKRLLTWLRYSTVHRARRDRAIEATRRALDEQARRGALRLDTPRPPEMPPRPVTPVQYPGAQSPYIHGHPGVPFSTRCPMCVRNVREGQ